MGKHQILSDFLPQPGSGDPAELSASVAQALRIVRAHLDMDIAFVAEFVGEHRVFRHLDGKATQLPVKIGDAIPLSEGYCRRVVEGLLPELIPDTAQVPLAMEQPITTALPIGAHLSVPIRLRDGTLYGTFCCLSHVRDPSLNARDLQTLRAFAEMAAVHIEAEMASGRERDTKTGRVRAAIENSEISIVYQPIFRLGTSQVAGFECLSRFAAQPQRPPNVWFEEATEVGLGVELEIAALRLGVRALDVLPADVYLAVNVSPQTVLSGRLAGALRDLPGERLVLEVTEHAPVCDYESLVESLNDLRRSGVRLAIDDVGSGYASLRHILRLKPDLMKLDISLIRNIHQHGGQRALAAALVDFARKTRAEIVAEGVETESELLALRDLGVMHAQGYLLDRPMPLRNAVDVAAKSAAEAAAAAAWLKAHRAVA